MRLLSNLATNVNASTLAWDLTTFLRNAATTITTWGGLIVVLIGLIMVIVGVYQIAKGFISHGKQQTNWVVAILLLLIGGALCFGGGWNLVKKVSEGGASTIEQLGDGTTGSIMFMLPYLF